MINAMRDDPLIRESPFRIRGLGSIEHESRSGETFARARFALAKD